MNLGNACIRHGRGDSCDVARRCPFTLDRLMPEVET